MDEVTKCFKVIVYLQHRLTTEIKLMSVKEALWCRHSNVTSCTAILLPFWFWYKPYTVFYIGSGIVIPPRSDAVG